MIARFILKMTKTKKQLYFLIEIQKTINKPTLKNLKIDNMTIYILT